MFLPVIKPIFRMVFRILSFILYGVTLLACYGGHINPAFLTFPSILVTAMPYFVIATLITVIIWAIYGRWITAGIGILVLVLAWSPISTAVPLHFSKSASDDSKTFKVMTYNILHGDDQEKGNDAPGNRSFEYVLRSGADIVCLQELVDWNPTEVHHLESFQDSLKKVYPYWAGSTKNDQKVLSKYPIRQIPNKVFFGPDASNERYSVYRLNVKGRDLTLINMHLNSPALSDEERNIVKKFLKGEGKESLNEFKGSIRTKFRDNMIYRCAFANQIREALDKANNPIIICGDFNDVPESYCYRLLRGDDLRDAYVETGFGPLVTYNRHAFWFHLDQILYRGKLEALSVKKGSIRSSDHYPLIAEFEFTD